MSSNFLSWFFCHLSHQGSQYIMQNARLDKAQAGIRTGGRNINNLTYADDTSLRAESESESHSVMCDSLQLHGLYSPWNSPGQNTRMGSLSLLQGMFPTQGSNPGLPHCRQILYQLSHKGSPRILEWVAYPFSSRYSWPRNWTRVSWIADGFFTNWATREAIS